jgi:hypothetical protein
VSSPFTGDSGDLRLDEVLGARCVLHYTRVLSSASREFAEAQSAMAEPAAWTAEPGERITDDGWSVAREGGPVFLASSCQELVPWTVRDVRGYYRRLGVPTRATTRELRLAYLALDPMARDEGLRYALLQLLDPATRRAYDLTPEGGLFLDRDNREGIERAAALRAAALRARAWLAGRRVTVTQEQVLQEWGFMHVPASPPGPQEPPPRQGWEWGWYSMRDPQGASSWPGRGELSRWQGMIAAELSSRGVFMRFAVGAWPGDGPRVWRDSNEGCIVFMTGAGRATSEMARYAVSTVIARKVT